MVKCRSPKPKMKVRFFQDMPNEVLVMKDEILKTITMKDILDKYNIPYKRQMYHCPFHKDKTASAKMYSNSFYCFSCNRTGDIIQFVQYLFNLSFKEAMQKINEDFNLGLDSNTKIDYKKIKQIEKERELKKQKKIKLQQKYNELCKKKSENFKKINKLNRLVSFKNWESLVFDISELQTKCEIIDLKLDEIDKIISSS